MGAVRRVLPHERETVLDTVLAAFRDDPQVRWWFPDDEVYADGARRFFGVLLDNRIDGGEVWVAEGGAAVGMWNPPGGNLVGPDVAAARYAQVVTSLPAPSGERITAVDEAVAAHGLAQAHWYLGVLATAPSRRGEGLASAVMAPLLAAADRTAVPVVLETATRANVGFYARHGFRVRAQVLVDGGAPTMWVMVRDPSRGQTG